MILLEFNTLKIFECRFFFQKDKTFIAKIKEEKYELKLNRENY